MVALRWTRRLAPVLVLPVTAAVAMAQITSNQPTPAQPTPVQITPVQITLGQSASGHTPPSILKQMQQEVSAIVTRARSAVVTVEEVRFVSSAVPVAPMNEKANWFGEPPAQPLREGERWVLDPQGNRMVVSDDGKILRSYSVPDNPEALDYRLHALESTLRGGKPTPEDVGRSRQQLSDEYKLLVSRLERARQIQDAAKRAGIFANEFTRSDIPKSGSGFSIGSGYILTTADVLDGMRSPTVVTDDGTRIKARIIGLDPELNLGVLQLVARANIPSLKLGDSSSLEVGHFTISIGNQAGQDNSVALMLVGGIRNEGIYSGSHFYPSLIQIAGTVAPGISGAPLLDADGEVVGIMAGVPVDAITVRYSELQTDGAKPSPPANPQYLNWEVPVTTGVPSSLKLQETGPQNPGVRPMPKDGAAERQYGRDRALDQKNALGVNSVLTAPGYATPNSTPYAYFANRMPVTNAGYAVPINVLKPAIESLRSGRPIVHGWVGLKLQDERKTYEENGIVRTDPSVKVEGVYPDSPALRSGLQPGDVLITLNGEPIRTGADFRALTLRLQPGDTATIVVQRPGGPQTINLKIEPRPSEVKPLPITDTTKQPARKE